jgi:hypothetical protein
MVAGRRDAGESIESISVGAQGTLRLRRFNVRLRDRIERVTPKPPSAGPPNQQGGANGPIGSLEGS